MCHSVHRSSLLELREWTQAELVAQINACQFLLLEIRGPVGEEITGTIARLQFIDKNSLPKATEMYSKTISDVSNSFWEDVHDAYTAMQRECSVLVGIIEELVAIRKLIEPMMPKEE